MGRGSVGDWGERGVGGVVEAGELDVPGRKDIASVPEKRITETERAIGRTAVRGRG